MSELTHQLGINWKIFGAQVVNFFILLFVFKKFLYQPILDILKKRRKKIEELEEKSQVLEEKTLNLEELEKAKIAEVKEKSNEIIQASKKRSQKLQKEIIEQAKVESERIINEAKISAQEKQKKIIEEVIPSLNQLVAMAVEKVLAEKISSRRDEELIKGAINKAKEIIKN